LVRFLRNATVAKVAGQDSSLLQISSEERARVARVAELFGEEDLTRHLQIMLRTHSELGYRQEQRFHLELGLLKMAHAQRLLPLEQLLSDAAVLPNTPTAKPAPRPSIVSNSSAADTRRPETAAARSNYVSPFAADSARKGTPRQEDTSPSAPNPGPRIVAAASQQEPVILGTAAPDSMRDVGSPAVTAVLDPEPREVETPIALAQGDQIDQLQAAVLQALTDNNQRILVSMLSSGEWSVQGNELVIKVGESQTVVDMSLSPDARRIAIASASGFLGRAVKLKIVPGASVAPQEKKNGGSRPGPGGRGRAEQDPIVRRMQEKFGAEIRTVIDYREKR